MLILGLDNAGKTTILYKLYAPDRSMRHTRALLLGVGLCRFHWLILVTFSSLSSLSYRRSPPIG